MQKYCKLTRCSLNPSASNIFFTFDQQCYWPMGKFTMKLPVSAFHVISIPAHVVNRTGPFLLGLEIMKKISHRFRLWVKANEIKDWQLGSSHDQQGLPCLRWIARGRMLHKTERRIMHLRFNHQKPHRRFVVKRQGVPNKATAKDFELL